MVMINDRCASTRSRQNEKQNRKKKKANNSLCLNACFRLITFSNVMITLSTVMYLWLINASHIRKTRNGNVYFEIVVLAAANNRDRIVIGAKQPNKWLWCHRLWMFQTTARHTSHFSFCFWTYTDTSNHYRYFYCKLSSLRFTLTLTLSSLKPPLVVCQPIITNLISFSIDAREEFTLQTKQKNRRIIFQVLQSDQPFFKSNITIKRPYQKIAWQNRKCNHTAKFPALK